MTAYSHNDRLMGRSYLLEDKEIQHRICTGLDVFDMYPEVYTFRELFTKFGPISKTDSFVDVPRGLLTNGKKFSFLLKDGCQREDYHESKWSEINNKDQLIAYKIIQKGLLIFF